MPGIGTTAFNSAGDAFQLIRAYLNDVDIPLINTILSVVRAANITTVTTSAPHNLQQNNIVQIAFVTDSSFNGTQTVSTVPGPTTFTYVTTGLANASSSNGTASLLIQGDTYMDAVLLPFVNKAYRKVQTRFLEAGHKSATSEIIITNMPANTQSLTDSTNPQLPPTFLAPRELFERITGSGQAFAPMSPCDDLPKLSAGSTIATNGVWSWREDGIWFAGASNALDVLLRFFVAQTPLTDATSVMTLRGCLDPVASYGAYLAGNSRGSALASGMKEQFEEDIKEFLNLHAHARQYLTGRRKPNNRSRGRGYGFGFGQSI
jgi:hypothetical protein